MFSSYIRAPAWAAALLVPLAMAVLAPQALDLPQQPVGARTPGQHRPLPTEDTDEGLLTAASREHSAL